MLKGIRGARTTEIARSRTYEILRGASAQRSRVARSSARASRPTMWRTATSRTDDRGDRIAVVRSFDVAGRVAVFPGANSQLGRSRTRTPSTASARSVAEPEVASASLCSSSSPRRRESRTSRQRPCAAPEAACLSLVSQRSSRPPHAPSPAARRSAHCRFSNYASCNSPSNGFTTDPAGSSASVSVP